METESYKLKYLVKVFNVDTIVTENRSDLLILRELIEYSVSKDNRKLMYKLLKFVRSSDYPDKLKANYTRYLEDSYMISSYNSTINKGAS